MTDFWKKITENWQDSINLLLGVWLFFSVWILGFAGIPAAMWNALVFGAVIAIAAYMALVRFQEWEEWADMAIGVWLIVSPWILGFAALTTTPELAAGAVAATWNFVLVGIATFLLAAMSLRHHRAMGSA